MLSHIRLVNFKSYINEHVFLKRLTFLVGPSAAGKSNLLDALRFLQGSGSGMTVNEVICGRYIGGRELWPGLRGGAAELTRTRGSPLTIGTTWKLSEHWYNHKITCQLEPQPVVERELLQRTDLGAYLFDTEAPALRGDTGLRDGTTLKVALKREGRGQNPTAEYPGTRSLLTQIGHHDPMHPAVVEGAARICNSFCSIFYLDVWPELARRFVPRSLDYIGPHGENTSAVLRRLCRDGEFKGWLLEWLSQAANPELMDLDFIETDLGGVMLRLTEARGTRVSAEVLSDGLIRLLAIVTAVFTIPARSLLLIEEIDAGLPPSLLSLLMLLLEEIVHERQIQVLATASSPVVLGVMSEVTLGNTVVFARDAGQGETVMRRLKDLDAWPALAERRRLADLFAPDCLTSVE